MRMLILLLLVSVKGYIVLWISLSRKVEVVLIVRHIHRDLTSN